MSSITAHELSSIVEESILPNVEKPSRYLGCEVNAIRKEPAQVDLRIALAFPDLYDLGLPNLGILILYEALNRLDGVQAERVYMPAADMEAALRERGLPLFSLETRTPLDRFDCIGFTLQYELCYTNILSMLEMAGIPLLSRDRGDGHPLVIAGGPCAFNPEPLADFMDAFAIGDGEDVVLEIAAAIRETQGRPRAERLRRLAGIEGVYAPALYDTHALPDGTVIPAGPTVRRRVVTDLDAAPFPANYIVPFTQQVHDRLSLEVLRGCTQGCRFCQAGFTNRPVRERSLGALKALEEDALRATGYEEVALSSLSTCDYSRVKTLVEQAVRIATPAGAAVSLPSLRLDSFSVDLSEMVQSVRKSGLTFAPEAATPRMRAAINKWIPDEHLLATTGEVFARGWEVIKLYFMIGLPGEEDADVAAIADLSRRVLAHGRSVRRGARVNLGVSTFVPRPHTPFQWERQITIEETQEKQRLLHSQLRSGLKFGRHEAAASFLEGVFSRGDRRLGAVLLEAWRRGCRMDAWAEHFDFPRWMEAFAAAGVEPAGYLRERDPNEPLPWDHIDTFVSKEYLREERERARRGEASLDCRYDRCHLCGVLEQEQALCMTMRHSSREGVRAEADWRMPELPPRPELSPAQKLRFRFTKAGPTRFLSHLELLNAWTRALRRAGVPIAYSQGFHPQPKLAFGTALSLGVASEGEYADVVLNEARPPAEVAAALNAVLPEGIRILAAGEVPLNTPALMAQIAAVRYRVMLPAGLASPAEAKAQVQAFLARGECPIVRQGKKGPRPMDIRPMVRELQLLPDEEPVTLEMLLLEAEGARCRPADVLRALFALSDEQIAGLRLRKLESYIPVGDALGPVLESARGAEG